MKTLAFGLLLTAAIAIAGELPVTGIDTSTMGPRETRIFNLEGAVRVTITRDGAARDVRFERGGIANTYRLEPVDGTLRVISSDVSQGLIAHRVLVDGVMVGPTSADAAAPRAAESSRRYYICPKDETMVRVGRAARPAGELLCPIDGTPMKAGTGPASSIFLLQ